MDYFAQWRENVKGLSEEEIKRFLDEEATQPPQMTYEEYKAAN